jgi:hypothetical protein
MRSFLCALGAVAGRHAVYWRYGVCTWVNDVLMPRAGKVTESELASAVIDLVNKNLATTRRAARPT